MKIVNPLNHKFDGIARCWHLFCHVENPTGLICLGTIIFDSNGIFFAPRYYNQENFNEFLKRTKLTEKFDALMRLESISQENLAKLGIIIDEAPLTNLAVMLDYTLSPLFNEEPRDISQIIVSKEQDEVHS